LNFLIFYSFGEQMRRQKILGRMVARPIIIIIIINDSTDLC
jgi:hypothetical protein